MPKSKVRKKPSTATASRSVQKSASTAATRVKAAGPTGPVYISIMVGLMILGLLWLVVNYLWGNSIPGMRELGNWNFLVGFGIMVVGLLMTMRWR